MDPAPLLTVAACLFILAAFGLVTYRIAMRDALREIDKRFEQHINEMHPPGDTPLARVARGEDFSGEV